MQGGTAPVFRMHAGLPREAGQGMGARREARRGIASLLHVVGAAVGLLVGGCTPRTTAGDVYPTMAEYQGREIDEVIFVDPEPFDEDTLAKVIVTESSHCSFLGLPICLFGLGKQVRTLDLSVLRADVIRLEQFYRRSGYFGTRVVPAVEESGAEVVVRFVITRGDPVILEELTIEGTEAAVEQEGLRRVLPLKEGEIFDLGAFAASADTIRRRLLAEGYAFADVLRSYAVDTLRDVATASLEAIPGQQVVIDSIVVFGVEHLDRETVLRQLTFRQGDLLVVDELVQSQRNLYRLEIVQFATVGIAEDSLQRTLGDNSMATVVVRVAEGPVHLVDAAVGFGTVDCLRAHVEWVSRSFLGGARRLAIEGTVSKIGSGQSICDSFEGDPFARDLDYRLALNLTEPAFLSPRNQLTVGASAERQSEPQVYQREAQGFQLALGRNLGVTTTAAATLDIERARTVTVPALFCATFLVCEPSDIAELSRLRWKNSLGANWVTDRTDRLLDPTSGYTARVAVAWATRLLGSEVRFLRSTAEGSAYRSVRPEWVLAGRFEVGTFFGTASLEPGADFLPPDERFYAGGASSVRGFSRSRLGPGVYVEEGPVFDPEDVTFIPTGGTTMVVSSLELRTPAPFARDLLRLAWFVDAGLIERDRLWDVDLGSVRFTPGFGLRFRTPIGPVRLDVAYNGYGTDPGPLFLTDPETGSLIRVMDRYDPGAGSFFDRLRLHLAVGNPF